MRYNESLVEGWGVSMFHSLHCLSMLRHELKHYWSVNKGMAHGHQSRPRLETVAYEENHQSEVSHLKHCLAYIAEVRVVENRALWLYLR